uniref:Uncharacterized protein n=1 Tax=Strigamia maritima TaxID=126957 RepID=T1IT44_STRMM
MAFMMPVMKNQYNIYPTRSRKSSTCSNASRSRTASESAKSDVVLSSSPRSATSTASEPPVSRCSRAGSLGSSSETDTGSPTKVGSRLSLGKFHTKLVDKLRRKFKRKGSTDDEDGAMEDDAEKGSRSSA